MYGGIGSASAAVNTGVPGAIGVMVATGHWSLVFGVVLALCGGVGIALAMRARRQLSREFA